jgi:cell division protein ZapA
MKQVEVTILGQGYVLACPEGGEQRLAAAVAAVDQEMSAIRDAGRIRARERIAVLAALNLAYRLAESPAPTRGDAAATPSPEPRAAAAEDQAVVEALIRRIDGALGHDGRLL